MEMEIHGIVLRGTSKEFAELIQELSVDIEVDEILVKSEKASRLDRLFNYEPKKGEIVSIKNPFDTSLLLGLNRGDILQVTELRNGRVLAKRIDGRTFALCEEEFATAPIADQTRFAREAEEFMITVITSRAPWISEGGTYIIHKNNTDNPFIYDNDSDKCFLRENEFTYSV